MRPSLFFELIEVTTTRDAVFEDRDGAWGTRRARPPGPGWRIAHDRERHNAMDSPPPRGMAALTVAG